MPTPLTVILASAALTHLWLRNFEPPNHSFTPFIALAALPLLIAFYILQCTSITFVSAVITAYTSFYACLTISVVTYRLSPFHPLAKYPGPVIARVSKLWAVWKILDGKSPQYYQRLHVQYGSVVRIGPNELSIVDKDLLPEIAGTHGMPKGPIWDGRRVTPGKDKVEFNLIRTRNSVRHAQLRKAWNKAFATEPLAGYREILIKRVEVFQDQLEEICREAASRGTKANLDLTKWINYFSFDLMSDMAFGGGSEMLREGDKSHLLEKLEQGLILPAITGLIPWATQVALIFFPKIGATARELGAFAVQRAKMRWSQVSYQKDLFYHIVNNSQKDDEASHFSLIINNSILAILAGSETGSTALANIMYYLLAYPEYLQKLREELDENVPALHDGMTVTELDQLTSLPWLNAIINETLRLQPTLPTGLQRAPERGSGGKMVGPHFIKEGTAVQVPFYVLQRDPRYFSPDPEKFWPERWIEHGKDPNIVLSTDAFLPFSMGPANCVGKPFAIVQLRYVIALLVGRFDMKFQENWDAKNWENNLKDRFILAKGELKVEIGLRGKM